MSPVNYTNSTAVLYESLHLKCWLSEHFHTKVNLNFKSQSDTFFDIRLATLYVSINYKFGTIFK